MPNELYIPDLNPVRFYNSEYEAAPQYHSKHFDEYEYKDQHVKWEQKAPYEQKWQTSDITYLHFTANFTPIQVDVVDKYGVSRLTVIANPVRENKWRPGYFVFEAAVSWATINPGCYRLHLTAAGVVIWKSEPQLISVTHENTLLLEYRNSRYHGDVLFETGIRFGFRVEGRIGRLKPGRNNLVFEDQKSNPSLLSGNAVRSFVLKFGGSRGLPDWVIDKINLIWTCNSVLIDGKSVAATSESKEEYIELDRYPMRGIVMEVREGENRGSKIMGATFNTDLKMIVVHNIDSKMFGDLSSEGASNIIRITDIE